MVGDQTHDMTVVVRMSDSDNIMTEVVVVNDVDNDYDSLV